MHLQTEYLRQGRKLLRRAGENSHRALEHNDLDLGVGLDLGDDTVHCGMVWGPKMLNGGLSSVTRQYSRERCSSRISCFDAASVLVLDAPAGSPTLARLVMTATFCSGGMVSLSSRRDQKSAKTSMIQCSLKNAVFDFRGMNPIVF
jgi:hypothetical protein